MKESSRRVKNVIQLLLLTLSVIKPIGLQTFGSDSSKKKRKRSFLKLKECPSWWTGARKWPWLFWALMFIEQGNSYIGLQFSTEQFCFPGDIWPTLDTLGYNLGVREVTTDIQWKWGEARMLLCALQCAKWFLKLNASTVASGSSEMEVCRRILISALVASMGAKPYKINLSREEFVQTDGI